MDFGLLRLMTAWASGEAPDFVVFSVPRMWRSLAADAPEDRARIIEHLISPCGDCDCGLEE